MDAPYDESIILRVIAIMLTNATKTSFLPANFLHANLMLVEYLIIFASIIDAFQLFFPLFFQQHLIQYDTVIIIDFENVIKTKHGSMSGLLSSS